MKHCAQPIEQRTGIECASVQRFRICRDVPHDLASRLEWIVEAGPIIYPTDVRPFKTDRVARGTRRALTTPLKPASAIPPRSSISNPHGRGLLSVAASSSRTVARVSSAAEPGVQPSARLFLVCSRAHRRRDALDAVTAAVCASASSSACASAISGSSGVGTNPSSASSRMSWASTVRAVDW